MRDRLVASFVGLTVGAVTLYGVPRAYVLANLVEEQEVQLIDRSADLVAATVTERLAGGREITPDFLGTLLDEAQSLVYVDPDGVAVEAEPGGATDPSDVEAIEATRSLAAGGTVTLGRTGAYVDRRVSEALFPLLAMGLVLVFASAVLGFRLARNLARPFQDLALRAAALGRGGFDVEIPHYPIPEAEEIGRALRASSEELHTLLQREREFASNASHQLRTPITALRLQLEDLSLWPETPPEVAGELRRSLGELDRLSQTVGELLDLARGRRLRPAAEADLGGPVRAAVERWSALAAAEGRVIGDGTEGAVVAAVHPGPVGQILDVLIENAFRHGAGTITVAARDLGSHVAIEVCDEGPRPAVADLFHRDAAGAQSRGEGIGLAVARELAESFGGHLALGPQELTTFVLHVPRSQGRGTPTPG